MRTAIYPGSFDPVTMGHINVIRRAARVFDKVVVCVMVNSAKGPLFSLAERMDLIRRSTTGLDNVMVDFSDILLAEYAKRYENPVIVKGLRAVSDFESEFQMALINKKLNPDLDTLFLTANEQYTYLSSSAVKEMARYGADFSEFVPPEIVDDVKNKFCSVSGGKK